MSFFVTLPSNSSTNSFPNNTQSNYTTLLPKNIQLNDRYQVGLAEISYTQAVSSNIGTITIEQNHLYNFAFRKIFGKRSCDIIAEDCIPFDHLIIKLNNDISKLFKEFYDEATINPNQKNFDNERNTYMPRLKSFITPDLYFTMDIPSHTSLKFSGSIVQLLKLDVYNFDTFEAKKDPYKKFIQSFFDPVLHLCDNYLVYTDIITDQYYGDVSAKILRNVTPSGSHGNQVSLTFDTIHYVDLQFTNLSTININIRDSQGELIHFTNKLGKVVIKLHFKLK